MKIRATCVSGLDLFQDSQGHNEEDDESFESFEHFRDESLFHGRRIRIYKRAQIFVAELWCVGW